MLRLKKIRFQFHSLDLILMGTECLSVFDHFAEQALKEFVTLNFKMDDCQIKVLKREEVNKSLFMMIVNICHNKKVEILEMLTKHHCEH